MDVDKQGNVKAQGETVQRVLVDGKRFFGDDPKMATQNLPSDVIDKIQVFDDLSDQSKFTGFDDGNRVKTINIVTKKNMRKGYFGKLIAGVGDNGLYDEAANVSKFSGNQQISFIGQANNTNKQNFTVQDILGGGGGGGGNGGGGRGGYAGGIGGAGGGNFGGAGGNRAGGFSGLTGATTNNGITTTLAAGLNYRDNWWKNTDISGSYFYNNLLVQKDQKSNTENLITGDSSIFNNQEVSSRNRNINQRMNLNIETTFDSSNSMIIRPNVSMQQSDGSSATTTNTTRGLTPISSSTATTSTHNNGYNGTADVLFRHKFAKKGRTFSAGITFGGSSNDGYGNNTSNSDYLLKGNDSTSIINQHFITKSNSQNISATLSYTEPIGKHSIIELNYNYSYNKNNSDRYTYDYDSASKKFNVPDSLLTNAYENTYSSNRGTVSYRYQNKDFNMSVGTGVQFGNLTSDNTSKNLLLTQHYTNIYPSANLTYKVSDGATLRFNYSGRTSQPSAQQLQPVIDNSDPMNIKIGNPDLKQIFTNSFRLLFISFNRQKFTNMFASINASFVSNNIVNGTITNSQTGVDSIKPFNLNGTYNLSAFFNYGFPLKKPKSNLNFTTNVSDTRGVSLQGTDSAGKMVTPLAKNFTTNYTLGETIKWTTNLKNNFDMNLSASPTYNIAKYSLVSEANNNINYFSLALTTDFTYYTKSGWLIAPDFTYTYYGNRAQGYNTSVPLLNLGFAKQFFKDKRAELRLTIYDLLNQNVSVQRNVSDNYIQDVQTKVLTRYALLTFTYNLKSFGGQQPQQGRRGQGGFPGGRQGGGGFPGGGGGPDF